MTLETKLAGVPFAANLARFGDRIAVRTGSESLSYRELGRRVQEMAASFGHGRRLVALQADNTLPALVAYLAALSSGNPLLVLPTSPAAAEALTDAYDPDIVVHTGNGQALLDVRRDETLHDLHPELALLLSTSGSTGSPKLVRLSADGIQANAAAIAEYLQLRPTDRAATTLPLSYCYGMSVVNSHLLAGASLALTDLSVVDPCFWDLVRAENVTSFAAVPYTFDLLDRVGFADMDVPSLRYITQAGGRLDPERVRSYAELGRQQGWDLYVMYGQTEATARMAYLPPDQALEHPNAIGVPVPGGSFRLEPVPGLDACELVYSGPNVMLGYAERSQDLSRGRVVDELHTGDLARRGADGLYEIVGRRSRFVKIVGLRVDLGQVERMLADLGVTAAAAGSDDAVVAVVEGDHDLGLLAKTLAQDLGLPRAAVELHPVEAIPRLSNGKPDYPAVAALAGAGAAAGEGGGDDDGGPTVPDAGSMDVGRIFAEVLEVGSVAATDTFVSLGGDSLSYVAASIRLEDALGYLPEGWHLMPVCELSSTRHRVRQAVAPPEGRAGTNRTRRLFAPMETGIVLRTVAMVAIVSTHIGFFHWQGTAHVLMAVAGYNFARFQLSGSRTERFRRHLRSIARIVVPSVAVIGLAFAVTDKYAWHNLFLLNTLLGPPGWSDYSRFWFVEILVHILTGLAFLLAVPAVDRVVRRWPWACGVALVVVDMPLLFGLVDSRYPGQGPVLWLFGLGWAAAASRTVWQRSAVTALAFLTVPASFDNPYRSATILAGCLLLLWLPALRVPRGLHRTTALLASASLYIYVTHWLVYPLFESVDVAEPLAKGMAVLASMVCGILYWAVATRAMAAVERHLKGRRALPPRIAVGREAPAR
ncbi:acyl-coenzyme A synthetase/AMP-(fatty) acid ligase [Pseudarthrobacter defluvii]|uniref:Acyl-coenzyme A synthetase/AMP-(Fatty) acid ligase n=1 Tax=Pseudarthrobacter defluvii TaxID=410837 RepID=A0ABT9UEQ2_9MICC|nr:AMP-binding protein [Pseudarthrobacter defluvii]MDQ0118116.1 acyl-coenzyme A synthetase/AMP-(fatty) acid ligase [Pseudarthrobacter defluvii]